MNYLRRRNLLKNNLLADSIVLLFAGEEITQSEDSKYDFFVNRNFYYLTGISEPKSVLLIANNQEQLLIEEIDAKQEKWFGKKISPVEAQSISEINLVNYLTKLDEEIKVLINSGIKNIYVDYKANHPYVNTLKKNYPNLNYFDIYDNIVSLRMIKDNDEIECIKEAISITKLGLNEIVHQLKNNEDEEYKIFNAFNHEILNHGTHEIGFPSIIASGVHTCCLHYPTPNDKIKKDSLLLCDVGAAFKHYSSDITRTYPVSGKFNELQKKIYQAVLFANKQVINAIKPGITLKELQSITQTSLTSACFEKGLIKDQKDLASYYFHNVSHHLGLNTHDACDKERPLEPGMVITVEPGLYFEHEAIGVRIEDDVLVTSDGHEVLSHDIPKEINEIEKLF